MKTLLAIIVLHLLAPAFAESATRYVSPTGRGSDCTTQDPCSVETGRVQHKPGDTVYLKAGIYPQTFQNPLPSGISALLPSVFECESPAAVQIRPTSGSNVVLLNSNRNWITFRNCRFDASGLRSGETSVFRINSANIINGLTIEGNIIENPQGPGLAGGDGGKGAVIRKNIIRNSVAKANQSGVGLYFRFSDSLIEENEIHGFPLGGISLYSANGLGVNNNTVRRNRVWGNGFATWDRGQGIDIARHSNTVIENEVFKNHTGISVTLDGRNTKVIDNWVYDNNLAGEPGGNAGKNIVVSSGISGVELRGNQEQAKPVSPKPDPEPQPDPKPVPDPVPVPKPKVTIDVTAPPEVELEIKVNGAKR